jgi:4-hydroxy-4-methyl-2-oxoglutarate aldolase
LVAAGPGDVLVAEAGGRAEHGYFGEIMAVAAMARGIAGLVIDAGVRDADRIQALGFPVFARALCIRGTAKDPHAPGAIGAPVRIGEVIVNAGDLVVGDRDGLVAIPAGRIADVLDAAEARDRREAEIMARLRAGATTMELFGLR